MGCSDFLLCGLGGIRRTLAERLASAPHGAWSVVSSAGWAVALLLAIIAEQAPRVDTALLPVERLRLCLAPNAAQARALGGLGCGTARAH